jgi:hypothetical protein
MQAHRKGGGEGAAAFICNVDVMLYVYFCRGPLFGNKLSVSDT